MTTALAFMVGFALGHVWAWRSVAMAQARLEAQDLAQQLRSLLARMGDPVDPPGRTRR
jgi:hypothetical protein